MKQEKQEKGKKHDYDATVRLHMTPGQRLELAKLLRTVLTDASQNIDIDALNAYVEPVVDIGGSFTGVVSALDEQTTARQRAADAIPRLRLAKRAIEAVARVTAEMGVNGAVQPAAIIDAVDAINGTSGSWSAYARTAAKHLDVQLPRKFASQSGRGSKTRGSSGSSGSSGTSSQAVRAGTA